MSVETELTPLPSGSDSQLKELESYVSDPTPFDTTAYDAADASSYYSDSSPKRHIYDKKSQFGKSWRRIIKAKKLPSEPELDTGEMLAIKDLTDKINSGELFATDDIKHEIGVRAVALVAHVDEKLFPLDVESTLLRVVAIDPTFKDEADKAIQKIYHDREETNPQLDKIIHATVQKTAEVASHPEEFIDPDTFDGSSPSVDRILEEALTYATIPRINHAVLKKQWKEEDNARKNAS